jgi:hypothetical protein
MNKLPFLSTLLLLLATQAQAQSTRIEVVRESRAITEEGDVLRGKGHFIRSQGEYLRDWAEAYERVQRGNAQAIENAKAWEEATRQTREYQTVQGLTKRIEKTPPRRLPARSLTRNGTIVWPGVLLDNRYRAERQRIEELFAARAEDVFGQTARYAAGIHEACGELAAELDAGVLEIGNTEYLAGARFLRNLAHESQFPAGETRVTAK